MVETSGGKQASIFSWWLRTGKLPQALSPDGLLRQSAVLAEHRVIGLWEVLTPVQKTKALKLLKKMNVTNIHVKVVKP